MGRRKKILVAGGLDGQGQVVSRALAPVGYGLKLVEPDDGFLDTVKEWEPDLIILGTGKSRAGPARLIRLLRADSRTRPVPILSLMPSHRSARAWSGVGLADDVVRRPIVPRELAIRVRALLRLATLTRETQRRFRRLEAEARIDPLTGLATRAAFRDRIVKELVRAERYRRPLALLIADVDHFKHYNDSLGHPAGDRLLRQVGRMVRGQVRRVDFGARYGGDEFAILLPETVKAAAGSMAERLRAAVEHYSFPQRHSQPLGKVSVSIGVAMFPEDGVTQATLVEAADRALYRAKADGRNLVRLAGVRENRTRCPR